MKTEIKIGGDTFEVEREVKSAGIFTVWKINEPQSRSKISVDTNGMWKYTDTSNESDIPINDIGQAINIIFKLNYSNRNKRKRY